MINLTFVFQSLKALNCDGEISEYER